MILMSSFAERLKELRTEKGLSTKELGKHVGVSGMAISRWERSAGVPVLDNVVALANFFEVTVGYMAGVEN